jgi:hypothetical protein
MDMQCEGCWGPLLADPFDDLDALHELPPLRVTVEMDDDVYAALDAAAAGRGVSIADVVRGIVRGWAEGQKARR